MPARILIGIGNWLLLMGIASRMDGRRSTVAKTAAWLAVVNAPLGIARFLVTLGDAEFAADPGVGFGVLWALHLFGTIASAVLIWLAFGTIAPSRNAPRGWWGAASSCAPAQIRTLGRASAVPHAAVYRGQHRVL